MDRGSADIFDELKKFLANLPLLTKTISGEPLILYVSVGSMAVSSVLPEEENRKQKPIYYVSRLLHEGEQRYAELEKGAWALPKTKTILPGV